MSTVCIEPAFSPSESERIISMGHTRVFEPSKVQIKGGHFVVDNKVRTVAFVNLKMLDESQWIIDRINSLVDKVKGQYDFDLQPISYEPEPVLLLRYRPGGHYNWHKDTGTGELKDRRLTLIVQLSEPDSYVGAETQFRLDEISVAPKEQGKMILFPSQWSHRVTQLNSGERYCLVTWVNQYPSD